MCVNIMEPEWTPFREKLLFIVIALKEMPSSLLQPALPRKDAGCDLTGEPKYAAGRDFTVTLIDSFVYLQDKSQCTRFCFVVNIKC